MLAFYAERFPTVEINNTFYRMPARDCCASGPSRCPTDFTFVLKAPQRITHQQRLADAGEDVAYFFETAARRSAASSAPCSSSSRPT